MWLIYNLNLFLEPYIEYGALLGYQWHIQTPKTVVLRHSIPELIPWAYCAECFLPQRAGNRGCLYLG